MDQANDMIICITAKSPSHFSEMDDDFEKCTYFTFFVEGSMGFEATINNEENNPVQLLIHKGVDVTITRNISSKSLTELNKANIKVFTASSKLIIDALNKFRNGELKPISDPTVGSQFNVKGVNKGNHAVDEL